MQFEWDPKKAAANLAKHNISFDLAATVFADPDRIEEFSRSVGTEERFLSIGTAADGNILTIAYTWRVYENQTNCRLISARKARRKERGRYAAVH